MKIIVTNISQKVFKVFLMLITIKTFGYSQDTTRIENNKIAKNSIYAELGGNSPIIYSINYDRVVLYYSKFKLVGKFGTTISPEANHSIFLTPSIMGLTGKGKNFFEFGIAHSFAYRDSQIFYDDKREGVVSNFLVLGYRRQPFNHGLVFRITATPVIFIPPLHFLYIPFPIFLVPWGGISIGYAF